MSIFEIVKNATGSNNKKILIDQLGLPLYTIIANADKILITILKIGIDILCWYIIIKLATKVIKYFIRYGVDYYIEKTKDKEKPRP